MKMVYYQEIRKYGKANILDEDIREEYEIG